MDSQIWENKKCINLLLSTKMSQTNIYAINRVNIFYYEGTVYLPEGLLGMKKKYQIIFKGDGLNNICEINYSEYLSRLIEIFDKMEIIIYQSGWFLFFYPKEKETVLCFDASNYITKSTLLDKINSFKMQMNNNIY